MHLSQAITAVLMAGSAAAYPLLDARDGPLSAEAVILKIMPKSSSCEGSPKPDECRTAAQAAPHFINAMTKYGIYSPGELAGILAVVAYESNQMQYNRNLQETSGGAHAGQGTSNMQMANWNLLYAQSIPELAQGLAAAGGDPHKILDLLTADEYNFGSGPWFYSSQCSAGVKAQLQKGTVAGWNAYMGCVGADNSEPGRLQFFQAAQAAFGISG